jgi:aminopeptidase N
VDYGLDFLRKMPAGTPALLYCEDSMRMGFLRESGWRWRRIIAVAAVVGMCVLAAAAGLSARDDDPYARSRDYDLQNVRTHLRFDIPQKKIMGEVTESLAILRENVGELRFDSVGLTIESVTLNRAAAKFDVQPKELVVALPQKARRGEHFEVTIRYSGQPTKGLYFILPGKNYLDQPMEIWSQGESEDTRYYIPIYDYPNDRTTSEMLLTVPGDWWTVSNGKLVGIKSEADGTKTWDWKQSETLSTYLISVVAGEFVEKRDSWRGIPVQYAVPKGQEYKIDTTFLRTKGMLDAFSDALDVKYPWAKYAQTSVDDFIEGGMENTSATTLIARALVHPKLAGESIYGSDELDSHELAHQWFGDLVTCKDWANIWLNEGFATYFEHYWTEKNFSQDDAEYEFWLDGNRWMSQKSLFGVPIVTRQTDESVDTEGNIYTKGGLVLKMLREKLGDQDFFRGLHHYLEVNRGQNVVTADLIKAIEQETSVNVDEFFQQWIYRAGAPKFEVAVKWDDLVDSVHMQVKQTQEVKGLVPLFHVPVEVEIATKSGVKIFPIDVSKDEEIFSFAVDGPPLMVIFDKGNKILKSVEFKREPAALIYQLKRAETVPDRAEAAKALGEVKGNAEVVAALGEAARADAFWGVRGEALRALGKIGDAVAEKELESALSNEKPWVRDVAVGQLGNFKTDSSLGLQLAIIAMDDPAYRVRNAAMQSLAQLKAANAFDVLSAAVQMGSPDNTTQRAALRAFGTLGDDRAVPILLAWAAAGKPIDLRQAAIGSLGPVGRGNKDVTRALVSYLDEPRISKFAVVFALGRHGDPDAIPALENLLKGEKLGFGLTSVTKNQIESIRAQVAGGKAADSPYGPGAAQADANGGAGGDNAALMDQLEKLERRLDEMNERLAKIEEQVAAPKK